MAESYNLIYNKKEKYRALRDATKLNHYKSVRSRIF